MTQTLFVSYNFIIIIIIIINVLSKQPHRQYNNNNNNNSDFPQSLYRNAEMVFNLLKPNDIHICRTAALTSRRYILNIYSTNIHTEYFKHAA